MTKLVETALTIINENVGGGELDFDDNEKSPSVNRELYGYEQ